ncbi:hypothetical protein [Flavobacterium difficile]|uniref:YhhN-like protein n=1 Tax=Flavobacterium difficile TaxID=2709659 RepID=A0ABX0I679_9FLAO|nr:hypothetical protein [Flavobacterium difficile]NHM02632.1 hypothetical protein [Flavobacterium difficile]
MKKNIQSLLKRDLEVIPLIAYFVFYILYLFFERILELQDYAVIIKPIIIPIIVFLYVINPNSKKSILSIFLLVLLFITDNSSLLEIRSIYVYSMVTYMITVFILLYYAVLDMKLLQRMKFERSHIDKIFSLILFSTLVFWLFFYSPKQKSGEKFIVYEYLIIFSLLFICSLLNFIQLKTKKTKYLLLSILCWLFSDLFFSIHHYYNGHDIYKYLICLVEIPIYYYLLKYLLKRDEEEKITEQ